MGSLKRPVNDGTSIGTEVGPISIATRFLPITVEAQPCTDAGGGEAGGDGADVDVEAEECKILSVASVMGIGRQDVERALLHAHGNWESVLQALLRLQPIVPAQCSVQSCCCPHALLEHITAFVNELPAGEIHTLWRPKRTCDDDPVPMLSTNLWPQLHDRTSRSCRCGWTAQ